MSGEMKDYVWCGCGDGYPGDSWMAGFMAKAGKCHACDLSDASPPPPEDGWVSPLPAELGDWLTAVGELYAAMGRPAFDAETPTLGVVETLREAARRLAFTPPPAALEPKEQQ